MLNDRLHRLGDIVDHELGIRLVGVEPDTLTFRDAHGTVYSRHF